MSLLVIKLGGSIITYKNNPKPRLRKSNIKYLAMEISEIYKKGHKIILVHGSGSGHHFVKKYNLHKPDKSRNRNLEISLIDQKTLELSSFLINTLLENRVPAIYFPPHTMTIQSEGNLVDFNTQEIELALNQNLFPVLPGEMVLDDNWGSSVLSGDITTCFLAKKLNADKVIFLTDVDGVFDSNPKKNKRAKEVEEDDE